jgi:hypothetical protein
LRGHSISLEQTWSRGTVDSVDPEGKVLDTAREMKENPDISRTAWAKTRTESR